MLHLGSECHSLPYDALRGLCGAVFHLLHIASLQKRYNEDDQTFGEFFLLMVDDLVDTTFAHAMQLIVDIILQSVQ